MFFEGEAHTVLGWGGPTVRLRSAKGLPQILTTVDLLDAPDFEILDAEYDKEAAEASTPLDDLPDHLRRKAEERQALLREVKTGYRSGDPGEALPDEPRPEYDPSSTRLEDRVLAKSRETKCSRRTIYRDLARYSELGLWGLVDKRQTRLASGLNLDRRVHAATERVLQELTGNSTVSHNEIRRRVQLELDGEHGAGIVRCPPKATFNRQLNELARGRGTFGASAKARRSIANRPGTPYRHFQSTRPGEYVLIDSSPYDVFAVDPASGCWVALELTIALDLYTRSIVGWRFTPRSGKGVDAALILHDVLAWKPMRPGWPESARWRYHGVPDSIVIPSGSAREAALPAGIPALLPEAVVVDRGRMFLSQTFQDACSRLGISIQLARPYRPTDKAQVERHFRTIRESLLEKLPGYKGPDVHSRGAKPEEEACLLVGELEELFAQWVASWWQVRHHKGLHLPGQPQIRLSPNEMYDEGIARWGLLHVPPSRTLYFELLPTAWRKIQHYGVDLGGLRYDGEAFNSFRNRKSPYNGVHQGDWPIKHDPRDLSEVYFRDPDSGEWHVLRWIGQADPNRPFSDVTLRYAKKLLGERGGNGSNHGDLESTLNDLLQRFERNAPHGRAELRLAGKRGVHDFQVARDRSRGTPPSRDLLPELDDFDDLGDLFDKFDPDEITPLEMLDPDDDRLHLVTVWDEETV